MMTVVIPKITGIITESGQEIPIYTRIVIATSNFLIHYGFLLLAAAVVGAFFLWSYTKTEDGQEALSRFRLAVPYIGNLYQKLFLSRIADNMHTMVLTGIPMIEALEITSRVVGDKVYRDILVKSVESVRSGNSLSVSLSLHPEIPGILVQMIKIGEETGELGNILKTMSKFYQREVMNAVDTLVGMIEPIMIVSLGVGVGILLASVLMPIYNIASTVS